MCWFLKNRREVGKKWDKVAKIHFSEYPELKNVPEKKLYKDLELPKGKALTLSWRRPLLYRNQSMDWFLHDNGLRHERLK